jgi:hypothetical protein
MVKRGRPEESLDLMRAKDIAIAMHVSLSTVNSLSKRAMANIERRGQTALLYALSAMAPKVADKEHVKAVKTVAADAARALELAIKAGLKPRLQAEIAVVAARLRAHVAELDAAVPMRCGSLECRRDRYRWIRKGAA